MDGVKSSKLNLKMRRARAERTEASQRASGEDFQYFSSLFLWFPSSPLFYLSVPFSPLSLAFDLAMAQSHEADGVFISYIQCST